VRDATEGEGIDVVFEHIGQAVFDACIKLLTKGGRLITCGATTGAEAKFDIRYVFSASWRFTEPTSVPAPSWEQILPHMVQGRLRPIVDSIYDLHDARAAHERLERPRLFRQSRAAHTLSGYTCGDARWRIAAGALAH
jgi:NADPH:quinone reductase-like Zn-dependent oxidoreductase